MGFDCPSCGSKTPKLVIYTEPKKLGCPNCGIPKAKAYNVNLGQTVESWRGPKGNKHRITVGKKIEIESRTLSEGKMVSKDNGGREAQY